MLLQAKCVNLLKKKCKKTSKQITGYLTTVLESQENLWRHKNCPFIDCYWAVRIHLQKAKEPGKSSLQQITAVLAHVKMLSLPHNTIYILPHLKRVSQTKIYFE